MQAISQQRISHICHKSLLKSDTRSSFLFLNFTQTCKLLQTWFRSTLLQDPPSTHFLLERTNTALLMRMTLSLQIVWVMWVPWMWLAPVIWASLVQMTMPLGQWSILCCHLQVSSLQTLCFARRALKRGPARDLVKAPTRALKRVPVKFLRKVSQAQTRVSQNQNLKKTK